MGAHNPHFGDPFKSGFHWFPYMKQQDKAKRGKNSGCLSSRPEIISELESRFNAIPGEATVYREQCAAQ